MISLCLFLPHSTEPERFLCLWMKEEVQRRLKCKDSSVSPVSLRQEWHHGGPTTATTTTVDERRARIIHESRGTRQQRAQCLQKVTRSAGSFSKWPPFMSYSPKVTSPARREISLSMAPTWSEKGRRLSQRVALSKCLFSNLGEKFAVWHKSRTVAERDNFVWHLSSNKAAVKKACAGGGRISHAQGPHTNFSLSESLAWDLRQTFAF